MAPYSIACSTCGARLKVRDPKAIGELSLCPKCGSMVMITPPAPGGSGVRVAGERATSDSSQQIIVRRPSSTASDFEDAAALFADTVDDLGTGAGPVTTNDAGSGTGVPPATAPQPTKQTPKRLRPKQAGTGETQLPLAAAGTPPPIAPPTESMSSIELDPQLSRGDRASPLAQAGASGTGVSRVTAPRQTFDLAPEPAQDSAPQHLPADAPHPAASLAGAPPPVVDDRPWSTPTQQLLRRYSLIGGAVVAAVLVVSALLALIFRGSTTPAVAEPTGPGTNVAANIATPGNEPADIQPPADPSSTPVTSPADEDEGTATDSSPDDLVVDPPAETIDDDSPPPDELEETTADDAPPIFTEPTDESPEESSEVVADAGLGDFAPLIDAFPIPDLPEREPVALDPMPPLDAEPEPPPRRKRPEPLAVDVKARLADPIDGIDTGVAPLVKFLELISQLSTIPITLPPESLAQVQATARSPLSIVLRDTNVEQVLQAGLAEHQLKFVVRGEQIVVIPAPKREAGLLSVSHPVEDLAPDAAALAELAARLRTFVAPEAWDTAGGEAKIDISKGKLEIRGVQAVQFDVHVFCQKLRVARGLEPRSKLNPAMFALESRSLRSERKLATPVRAIFHAERPLTRILNHLEEAADMTLLVDWEALLAEGWPPQTTTALIVEDQPLATALDELLTPMDLAWRAIDEDTVQITSQTALESRPELEFYSVAPQIDAGTDPEKLVADLKTKLGDDRFAAAGLGAIEFDTPSKCLVVRLPQAFQRKLAEELTTAAE